MDYFIADTHFGNEFIAKMRGFSDSNEMDSIIISKWTDIVKDGDRVFLLGDVFDNFDLNYMESILDKLTGYIVVIKGSHDTDMPHLNQFEIEYIDYPIIYKQFYILSHEPMFVNELSPYANIFGHIHDNPNYKDYSSRGFCVSAERINYTPKKFDVIKNYILGMSE